MGWPLACTSPVEMCLKVSLILDSPKTGELKMLNLCVLPAVLYATVSASYTIEQGGLPKLSQTEEGKELWNGDDPKERLLKLRARVVKVVGSS